LRLVERLEQIQAVANEVAKADAEGDIVPTDDRVDHIGAEEVYFAF
jgi:hypothetical protein